MKEESKMEKKIFGTDRRIRLGIWGLGRGSVFIKTAAALNIDIVAGCDLNKDLRERFRETCPDALITDNEDEFLACKEMDAVIVATFFMSHAEHTLKALAAGKHVMCEVTSFYTPAEGVKVVEAVEKSGKVYNLLENYPFTKVNMYLADLWKKGFFGEFAYGEFEYLHECRILAYGFKDFRSNPGYTAHAWRSWFDFHYYNTHSLGPLMKITGLRPEVVTALPTDVSLPGYLPGSGAAKACPSLIRMSNGGLMRNLCGATTGDYHSDKRIWGTRASAEAFNAHGLYLRIGAAGTGEKLAVTPQWPDLAEYAESAGHGGGDFWELYYFAREILTGEKAPWDIYSACDVTLAGIMAAKSRETGLPQEIPDFRDPAIREKYRQDSWSVTKPFDPYKIFPEGHDPAITEPFSELMLSLHSKSALLRKAFDGAQVYSNLKEDAGRLKVLQFLREAKEMIPLLAGERKQAEELIARYPESLAAGALQSILLLSEPEMKDTPENVETKLDEKIRELLKK